MLKDNCCINLRCNGVMELVAKADSLLSKIEKVPRFKEPDLYKDTDEMLLIYKCSCCSRIDVYANRKLDDFLNNKDVFYRNEVMI